MLYGVGIYAVLLLATSLVFGVLTYKVAEKKGYYSLGSFFALGFFLWIIGFFYTGFLPEAEGQFIGRIRKALEADTDALRYPAEQHYYEDEVLTNEKEQGKRSRRKQYFD